MSGWDPDRFEVVEKWLLRDALLAYEKKLKDDATEAFKFDVLIYNLRAPWAKKGSGNEAPRVPDILRD